MDKFIFEKDGKTLQIRFSFPDKHAGIYRRHTMAFLDEKVINPEDNKDFVWKNIDYSEAKCNFHVYIDRNNITNKPVIIGDIFDKYKGRFVAFTKLINKNFDREFRKLLWQQFFDIYGMQIELHGVMNVGKVVS